MNTISAHAVLEDLPDAVLIIDPSGSMQYANLAAGRLLDVTHTDIRGRSANEILTLLEHPSGQVVDNPIAHLLANAASDPSCRYLLLRPCGPPLAIDYSIGTIALSRDTAPALVLVLRDASRTFRRIEQLTEAARYDEHTQLLRRQELEGRLTRVLQNMTDSEVHALLFMDLDRFKAINDTAGHLAGDMALREVAALLRAQVRERDTLARLGGDEFGLLLEHCPLEHARKCARRLQAALAGHAFHANHRNFKVGVSIGIAAIRHGRQAARDVIAAADAACYAAKRQRGATQRIEEAPVE